jgi:hypothetical protein
MARSPARWAVVLLVQLLIVAVVLEVGLRLARPFHPGLAALLYSPTVRTEYDGVATPEELLETTGLGFRPRRQVQGYVLNSRGFRTPEVTPEPAAGTLRIVVLGDSFAFASGGVPWSRMWTTHLEGALEARLERPVEVVNLGVPGVGPRFELRLWQLEGARLAPDLVLLALFVGNDLTDESGRPLEAAPEETAARWSVTWRLIRNLHRVWRERHREDAWVPPAEPQGRWERGGFEPPGTHLEPLVLSETSHLNYETARLPLSRISRRGELEELAAATTPVLRRLAQSVRRHGAELAVVMIPDELQVDNELLERLLERQAIPRGDIDLAAPQERLAAFFEAEGIPYLDLLPEMRRRSTDGRLYWPRNTHWNLAGNRLAGDLTAEFLAAAVLGRKP